MEALRLFELVKVSDLETLKINRQNTLKMIDTLMGFSTRRDDDFLEVTVSELDIQI